MANLPKILSITSELPWPLNSGGHLRTYHLLNALAQSFEVRLAYPSAMPARNDLPPSNKVQMLPFSAAPRSMLSECYRVAASQLRRSPYSMYFRHYRPSMYRWWCSEIESTRPDIVWLDHIDSFLFYPRKTSYRVPVVVDLHNVYSLILQRLSDESSSPLRRFAFRLEAQRMARIEKEVCKQADAVVAVSNQEAEHFRQLGARRVFVAPNGVDCCDISQVVRSSHADAPTILFIGAMNWQPNVSAAISLAKDIFPPIRNVYPKARLVLVGKDPIAEVKNLASQPGVEVTGTVPSVKPYLADASVFVVPLDSGGGTRLKVLEAFAAGIPVVSTAVGAEGIDALDHVHLRLASRENMASAVLEVLQGDLGHGIANEARKLAEAHYDWQAIGRSTCSFLNDLMSSRAS